MMDELLNELQPLVAAETERSKEDGEKYESVHDAVSSLTAHFGFCFNIINKIDSIIHPCNSFETWKELMNNKDSISEIEQCALTIARKAIQVAAVCEKIARGFEK